MTNALSVPLLLAIGVGGASGSMLRYAVSVWLSRAHGAFPMATFLINVGGSFLIGVFARVFSTPDSSPVLRAALTIGFCGGFTTFSTFSAEFVALWSRKDEPCAPLRTWPRVSWLACWRCLQGWRLVIVW